jgi:hypothetical protein
MIPPMPIYVVRTREKLMRRQFSPGYPRHGNTDSKTLTCSQIARVGSGCKDGLGVHYLEAGGLNVTWVVQFSMYRLLCSSDEYSPHEPAELPLYVRLLQALPKVRGTLSSYIQHRVPMAA